MSTDVTAKLTFSIRETEAELKLSHQSVYNELNSGRLKSYRVGRRRFVSRQAIESYIRDREAENVSDAA